MQQIWLQSLGQEDPLENEMATHSNTLSWKIPWMEDPGRLQSRGLQRVGHDWATSLHLYTHIFGCSLEGLMLKLKLQYFGHLMGRADSLENTLMLGKTGRREEKGTTEDEMAGWHHRLDGRESEWTPGVGDGQGGLACCDSWGRKELDTTERLIWSDSISAVLVNGGNNEIVGDLNKWIRKGHEMSCLAYFKIEIWLTNTQNTGTLFQSINKNT